MAPRLHTQASNVSNEVVASYAIELGRASRDLDEASGRRRAVLKRAKSAGINTRALLAALGMKKQDEDTVRIEMRDTIRYASILVPAIPLKQADLFDEAPAKPLNAKAQGAVQDWEAEEKGYDCGLNGGTMDDAVFAPGTAAYGHFERGYERGQAVIAERMGEHAKQADAGLKKRRGKTANSHGELRGAAAADDAEDSVGEAMGNA